MWVEKVPRLQGGAERFFRCADRATGFSSGKAVVRLWAAAASLLPQGELDGNTKEPAVRCRQVVTGKERGVELLDRNAFALEATAVVRRAVDLEGQDRAVPAFLAQPSALDPE